ncbi:MAG TPA: DUF6268 family outer membrane beta-barrel protein [Candidatus Deferrimicrobium sp.]|nr:DUF6268 family outer membrane beta-barrel protein [Candidatus Deferrimicrobium sp.]
MKHANSINVTVFIVMAACAIIMSAIPIAKAQSGPSLSVTYDLLPYQDFDDPVIDTVVGTDTTFLDHPQAQLRKLRASLSYPIVFSEGRTVLVNDLTYQLIEFKYRELSFPLERLQSASYTLMLQHRLSQKWSVWALGTPSLASDLGAEVTQRDFNFQAAAVFIRHFSERLSLGFGAAYTTQFGSGEVVPILAFDWNNGKNLMAKAILPASLEFWYRPVAAVDLGLLLSGDGNNFRGDPDVYHVADPELRYTMLTVGPAARIRLAKYVRLNIEGGLIGLHRFEFFDGDTEAASHDLKPSQYARIGLNFGA